MITISSDEVRSQAFRVLRDSAKPRGCVLLQDLPTLHLCKGDRLEPGEELLNVAMFEITQTPFNAVFWRSTRVGRVLHESPLVQIEGFGVQSWAIDLLHSWHLGPAGVFIGHVFWFVLNAMPWVGEVSFLDAEEHVRIGLLQFNK